MNNNKSPGIFRRSFARVAALVTASALVIGGAIGVSTQMAEAANVAPEAGVGIGISSSPYGNGGAGWLGSFYVPGVGFMYCLNPRLTTEAVNTTLEEVGEYHRVFTSNEPDSTAGLQQTSDLTEREAFEVSYIVSKYGQLDAPHQGFSQEQAEWAVATGITVWQPTQARAFLAGR